MINIAKLTGFFLLILVGYDYINEPLGFSIAGGIALSIFALCLMMVYRTYEPDRINGIGWLLITIGCLILSTFTSLSIMLFVPIVIIVLGYKLADLPFSLASGSGYGDSGDFGDSCGGDGGGCGGD